MNKTKKFDLGLIFETLTQDREVFAFTFLYAILFIFGIVANLAVVVVYLFQKNFKKHTIAFFISLSLSDILVLIVCIPISITDLFLNEWQYGLIYCKFICFGCNVFIQI